MDLYSSYKILGISKNSTTREVRERYLSLARQHHPDKHRNSVESVKKFQDIECAYRLIYDPASFKGQAPAPSRSTPTRTAKPPDPKPPDPKPPPKPPPKFKKGQNLDDFLNELRNDGHKKTGKKKDKWS